MIRAATLQDLEALMALEGQAFEGDRLSRRSMRYMLKNKRAAVFVAEQPAGIIAGYAILLEHQRPASARLYSLAVATASQGQGVADRLMKTLEIVCTKPAIRLEVRADNLRAIKFYEKKNYVVTGKRECYYHDNTPAILMLKRLSL